MSSLMTVAYSASGISFYDVKTSDWFYEDLTLLVDKGVINGYTNGGFKPLKSVSVAEFLKMSLVATNQKIAEPVGTVWYSTYVEAAIERDYIDSNYYTDYERPITRGEMGQIIDRILELNYVETTKYINKIKDYDLIASFNKESSADVYIAGIITGYADGTIRTNDLADRAEAATVIVRMIDVSRRIIPIVKTLSVDGIEIGMTKDYVLSHIGQADEILANQYGYSWYVYAGDYNRFKLIGIKDDIVVSFFSNIRLDSTVGISIGMAEATLKKVLTVSEYSDYYSGTYDNLAIKFYSEKGVDDGIEGVLVKDSNLIEAMNPTDEATRNMGKVVFHLTNGARVRNGLLPLIWSIQARDSSYKHSKDMATNDYFAHSSLSGDNVVDRMKAEAISGSYYAENIAAGQYNPFEMHYALMHSKGHRDNILTERIDHFGVGIYYSKSSRYNYYFTENFFEI